MVDSSQNCINFDMRRQEYFTIKFLSSWIINNEENAPGRMTNHLQIISPDDLCFDATLVLEDGQYWRLITNFFYLREMDCEFVVHLFLLAQYLKLLEETSFIGRKGDFLYMLLFGGAHLTMSAFIGRTLPYMDDSFAKNRFLSSSLIFMLVYVWSRQYPYYEVRILGFTFPAGYFPWIIFGIYGMHGPDGCAHLLGFVAGCTYIYFYYIFPGMVGFQPLKAPSFIKSLFSDDPVHVAIPLAEENQEDH